jgi:undecaprenyl-diphosphatase
MESQTIVEALFLGLLEGLTEFIPVSSTGHLLLAGHFLGFESNGKTLVQSWPSSQSISVVWSRSHGIFPSIPKRAALSWVSSLHFSRPW